MSGVYTFVRKYTNADRSSSTADMAPMKKKSNENKKNTQTRIRCRLADLATLNDCVSRFSSTSEEVWIRCGEKNKKKSKLNNNDQRFYKMVVIWSQNQRNADMRQLKRDLRHNFPLLLCLSFEKKIYKKNNNNNESIKNMKKIPAFHSTKEECLGERYRNLLWSRVKVHLVKTNKQKTKNLNFVFLWNKIISLNARNV